MLRRKSSNKVGRRKSTSSTTSKHESIDPEVARHHAHTAATLAFTRARERSAADSGHRAGGHSRNNMSSSQYERPTTSQNGNDANVNHTVKRQQSVRFVGPNAVHRRQSIGNRLSQNIIESKPSTATLRPMAMTTNAPVPAIYRPPSRSSSIGKASTGRGRPESFVTAVAAYNEYYTREDDVASTPSSYRRIRRSKSMFSPLKAPSVFYTNGTPEKAGNSHLESDNYHSHYQTPQSQSFEAPLRIHKSMTFLRGGREHLNRDRNDAAVQMARDRFFQQTAQQRLREQPSFLFRSKARRQEKPFRKSVRSASTTELTMPISFPDQLQGTKEPGLRDKARKASKSIKDKFKKVFGLNKESVDIPNQQVNARGTHVRKYYGDPDTLHNSFQDIPHPTEATLSRVASRPPSLHEIPSNQQLKSHAGSFKSTRSDISADNSRVTSWNSTGVNTLTSQAARLQAERELQRLSIINENGTHVPSSSFSRPKLNNQTSAYPHHHRPSKSAGHISSIVPGPVDSARVYSALMKRIDESSPRAKLEPLRNASVESFAAPIRAPRRSVSVNSSRTNRSPTTIRHVPPEYSNSSVGSRTSKHDHQWLYANSLHPARVEDTFDFAGTHVHEWAPADHLREAQIRDEDDVFSPKLDRNNMKGDNSGLQASQYDQNISAYTLSSQPSTRMPYHTVADGLGETPQEVAIRNEPVDKGAKNLRESRSTFFGGSSFTIARTTSPFRRALAESEQSAATNSSGNPSIAQPVLSPLYMSQEFGAMPSGYLDKAYSDSMYSRSTSGLTPAAANSTLSLPIHDESYSVAPLPQSNTGDVVIIDRITYRSPMPDDGGHRVTSSASSAEWKKWMSSEVARLERTKENSNSSASYVNYALPTMPRSFHAGHIREGAQIGDDDTDVTQRKFASVKQPLGILQQSANSQNIPQINPQNVPILKPILKNRSAVSLVENLDSSVQNGSSIPIPPPPPPPIPVRSPLRTMQSKSSLSSANTPHSVNTPRTTNAPDSAIKLSSLSARHLLHKRNGSTTTLKSMKSIDTPAKLMKRPKWAPHPVKTSSPGCGLSSANENQFGSTSTRTRTPGTAFMASRENHNPEREERDGIYGAEGAGLMGPAMGGAMHELDAQQMGSKRMVDMFLSSRRKRIAGGSEESGAVFI